MRNQDKYNLVLGVVGIGLPKQILEDRNLRQPRNSRQRPGLRVFHHAAEQVDFPIFQADFILYLALPDHRLADTANAYIRGYSRDVHRHLQ